MTFDLATLVQPATSKILLVVLDGLAGFATAERGTDLDPHVDDTDPPTTGVPPFAPMTQTRAATHTAEVVAELDRQARVVLADQPQANSILLRGLDSHRQLPTVQERYGLRAAA